MNHSHPDLRAVATRAQRESYCPCREQPAHPVRTEYGIAEDVLVMDAVVDVPYRCKLCGKKYMVQIVPVGMVPG